MLSNCYSLYDSKALVYSPPFLAGAHGGAVRMVQDLANDPNTTVGRHPADFTLYCVGHWNDATGTMLPFEVREHVSDVLPLIRHGRTSDLFRADIESDPSRTASTNGSK